MSFIAKYDGICQECAGPIYAGDRLVWINDQTAVVHADCEPDTANEHPVRATCPKCWQIITVSGACGCDPT